MMHRSNLRCRAIALATAWVLGSTVTPHTAAAADACKVKVDKKTRVMWMTAANSAGLPGWRDGNAPDDIHPYDYGKCVVDGSTFTCPLAPPDSPLATIPPPSCTVCVEDASGTDCCTRLKNCTPGTRDCVQIEENTSLAGNSEAMLITECPAGYKATGGGGSAADLFDAQVLSASRPTISADGWFCKGINQGGTTGSLSCTAVCCRQP